MASERGGRLVSAKARKIVQEFLSIISSPDTVLDKLDDCAIRMERVAEEVVPALAEALDDKEGKKRIGAAWFLINMAGPRPDLTQEAGLARRAEEMLVAALESDEDGNRLFALTFLAGGVVPSSANAVLRELLGHANEQIRATAAAAFLGGDFAEEENAAMGRGDAVAILTRALRGDKETLVAIAARALIRQSLNEGLALQKLLGAFEKASAMGKYYILQGLEQIGENAGGASVAVAATIMDETMPTAVRGQAAVTLGKIAADKDVAAGVLFDALGCKDWEVVLGAVNGLISLGKAGQRLVARLTRLLSADDENLWGASALGVQAMPQQALEALPALIERLADVSDLEVCGAMIDAIVAIGEAAIPALTEVIRRGDARRIRWASVALVRMGEAAAQHLAEALGQERDAATRYAYVMLLRDMGWKAAPAVPALGRILDETDDEELAYLATAAIFVCGQAGAPAAPSLVRCLTTRSAETASAAERSLKLIGEPAVTALEQALKAAEGEAKRRIEETLKYFRPGEEKRFRHLEKIARDDLLRLFVLVGTFLETEGPAGWRKIAGAICHRIDFPRIDGTRFGVTANSIAQNVKDLSELLKPACPLIKSKKTRKSRLTADGSKLLREAKAYLRRKYADSPELD